jgi:microcystin-dependent protein
VNAVVDPYVPEPEPEGIPIGTVIESASSTAPTNYLDCDGSALSRTTYANLFSVTGTIYGIGDGVSTFNIPDRRANVGRGAGTSVGYTQNVTVVQGEKTDDAVEEHTHVVNGIFQPDFTVPGIGSSGNTAINTTRNFNSTGASCKTANETRVKSIGMKYFIKVV